MGQDTLIRHRMAEKSNEPTHSHKHRTDTVYSFHLHYLMDTKHKISNNQRFKPTNASHLLHPRLLVAALFVFLVACLFYIMIQFTLKL